MRNFGAIGGGAAIALLGMTAGNATAVTLTDNAVANETDVTTGLVALDLSGIVPGLTTNNSYSTSFSAPGGAYTGTLTATVFGNVSTPGSSLNSVAIVYEFIGNGPSGIDMFEFGLNNGSNLDYSDLLAATHGTIGDLTTVGQGSPMVELFDNSGVPDNNNMIFDFLGGGDALGSPGTTESFGWYIQTTGDVAINFVDVEVTDFGAVTIQTLSLVDIPGQPDLNVPAPGSAALLVGAFGLAARRRR